MSEEKTYHANCLCSEVKFTLQGEPFHFVICHCRNCKQVAGSAFMANAMFKPAQVKVIEGRDLIKEYADSNTLTGNTISRSFCSKCGSTLFIAPAGGGIIITHPSLIEETVAWVPKKEFHNDQRWPWVKEITFQPKKKAKL
ncbi:hypothetical protein GALMADRAFT_257878 [Galerina marginata CBS 339.88]|uniref:CENP-V/GFA domain-containing protein n=1 Tax=Galerina marginata (strain CBS 339.88) TaxID=685588 RepID=A0A067S9R2_GALM3|nr:hypothetical protein GALMADRAFT_257878 [Galerina marginata CBS 339.88]